MSELEVVDKPTQTKNPSSGEGEDKKPKLVPAQTKSHYWLYKQGREVWNRWAREAFIDENGNDDGRIDELIDDAEEYLERLKKISFKDADAIVEEQKNKINDLKEFKKLDILSNAEKVEITKLIRKRLRRRNINLPAANQEIDFVCVKWQEKVDFTGFVFPYFCSFVESSFLFDTEFNSACFFEFVDFSFTKFKMGADFKFLSFNNGGEFRCLTFLSRADFGGTVFMEVVDFSSSDFNEAAYFNFSSFQGGVHFTSVNFHGHAFFECSDFLSYSDFGSVRFNSYSDFSLSKFIKHADFSSANFSSNANFTSAYFNDVADFTLSTFFLNVKFYFTSFKFLKLHKTVFEGDGDFDGATFIEVPKVSGVSLLGVFNFNEVNWPEISSSSSSTNDSLSYSQFKRLMSDSHLHHMEIFFFRKELLCRAEVAKRKSKRVFDSDWRTSNFIKLYEKVSECGDSITRPLKGLLALFLTMSYFYPLIAGKFKLEHLSDGFNIKEGIYLSLRHTVLFLPSSKTNYDSVMKSLFEKYNTGEVDITYIIYVLSSGLQTVLSIGLLFLVGLAARNHLRIK